MGNALFPGKPAWLSILCLLVVRCSVLLCNERSGGVRWQRVGKGLVLDKPAVGVVMLVSRRTWKRFAVKKGLESQPQVLWC